MRDFPFPGSKIVFFGNPKDMHNLFAEIFGEEETFPSGKNPSESSADFPNGMIRDEDCSACKAKDCPIRKAPYGSTQPAPSLMEALRAEKLKLDIAAREAVLARQAMGADENLFVPKVKLHPELGVPYEPGENVEAPILIKTPFGRITFPDMPKSDRDRQKRVYETGMKASKGAFEIGGRLDATMADMRKIEKKRKDAELDDLAARLYTRLSKHFYRERGSRLSRINELTRHVSELFEENRKLKADLAAKVEVLDFYKRAVANRESVDWNNSNRNQPTGAFVYVTGEEFDTLKALKAGTALVVPNTDHPWIDWIDPVTGKFVMPTLNALIEVVDPRIDGGEAQTLIRVTADTSGAVRFTYAEGGVNVFLTSANGGLKPFGFKESKWRYKKT